VAGSTVSSRPRPLQHSRPVAELAPDEEIFIDRQVRIWASSWRTIATPSFLKGIRVTDDLAIDQHCAAVLAQLPGGPLWSLHGVKHPRW